MLDGCAGHRVSLKDRKCIVDLLHLYSLLGVESVTEVVRHGLGMWSVRMEMIGCWPVGMWWWQG